MHDFSSTCASEEDDKMGKDSAEPFNGKGSGSWAQRYGKGSARPPAGTKRGFDPFNAEGSSYWNEARSVGILS